MNFLTWLAGRDIDCETLTTELEQSLRQQFDAEQKRQAPVAEMLVSPADCQWPRRSYRIPVIIDSAAAVGLTITRASDMSQ